MEEQRVLLTAKALTKYFYAKKTLFNRKPGAVQAVDGVDLAIHENETLGLVGESGCGKSTLGRTLLRLIDADGGEVLYRGENLLKYGKRDMWQMRRKMQIVFQDPYGSLNPRMNVEELVTAPLKIFGVGTAAQRRETAVAMLEEVELGAQHLQRYPHEFSGGQRQRIGIARALVLGPEFVVCDEPVSALDVSVRAQVLNLMQRLQQRNRLSYLFISHDLSVVRHISDRIAVMYLGKVVEITGKKQLYTAPLHPYTRGLLAAIPIPDTRVKPRKVELLSDIPSAYNPPSGCRFHTRCPYAADRCRAEVPELREYLPGHFVACHRVEEIPPPAPPAGEDHS